MVPVRTPSTEMPPRKVVTRAPIVVRIGVARIHAFGIDARSGVYPRLDVDATLRVDARRLVIVVVMLDDFSLDNRWRWRSIAFSCGRIVGPEISRRSRTGQAQQWSRQKQNAAHFTSPCWKAKRN